MIEIIIFSLGFVFAFIMLSAFAYLVGRFSTQNTAPKKTVSNLTPEQEKEQRELERQYSNMMNYNGSVQRGVDDEN